MRYYIHVIHRSYSSKHLLYNYGDGCEFFTVVGEVKFEKDASNKGEEGSRKFNKKLKLGISSLKLSLSLQGFTLTLRAFIYLSAHSLTRSFVHSFI